MMLELALILLQVEGNTGNPTAMGVFRFFAALFLILFLYGGAWLFTYWISKDE